MRTKGSSTNKKCWDCEVVVDNQVLHSGQYKTLKDISDILELSYNQVAEISNNRAKKRNGKYDTIYKIKRIVPEVQEEESIPPSLD